MTNTADHRNAGNPKAGDLEATTARAGMATGAPLCRLLAGLATVHPQNRHEGRRAPDNRPSQAHRPPRLGHPP